MQNDDLHSRLKYVKQGSHILNKSLGIEQSTVDWKRYPSDRSLFLLWKRTELELKRLNSKSKYTASNDNTPFEEGEDIGGPSNLLSPIVEGNQDTAFTGPSLVLVILKGIPGTVIPGNLVGQFPFPFPFFFREIPGNFF